MHYKVLGFIVWHGGRLYIKARYGEAPKRLALGVALAGGIGLAVFAQRQVTNGDD